MSDEAYKKYIAWIVYRLWYIYEELAPIIWTNSLPTNPWSWSNGWGNTWWGTPGQVNCPVDQPPIFPFHNSAATVNKAKLTCGFCSPNDPWYTRNGITYADGWQWAYNLTINNKTIFNQVADYNMFMRGIGWPGSTWSSEMFNIKKENFLSLKFTVDDLEAHYKWDNTWRLQLTAPGNHIWAHAIITMSISECPWDFSVHLNQNLCKWYQLYWSTDASANEPFANAPNPDARDGKFCILERWKTYYWNIVHSKSEEDNYQTSSCISSSWSCGVLVTQTVSNDFLYPAQPNGKRNVYTERQWNEDEKDNLNSKTISWPANNVRASVEAFKYTALEFKTWNEKLAWMLDAFWNMYRHNNWYDIAPTTVMAISKTPGDFTKSLWRGCSLNNGWIDWAVWYTVEEVDSPYTPYDLTLFPRWWSFWIWTCLLEKNTTYYLNIMQWGMSNKYTTCEADDNECSLTLKNETMRESKLPTIRKNFELTRKFNSHIGIQSWKDFEMTIRDVVFWNLTKESLEWCANFVREWETPNVNLNSCSNWWDLWAEWTNESNWTVKFYGWASYPEWNLYLYLRKKDDHNIVLRWDGYSHSRPEVYPWKPYRSIEIDSIN